MLSYMFLLIAAAMFDGVVFITTGNSLAGTATFAGVVAFGAFLKLLKDQK